MVSLPTDAWTMSSIDKKYTFGRKATRGSISTAADDSFEVVADDSLCVDNHCKNDDFAVDLDIEEKAIMLYNLDRINLPNFNYLHIGKGNKELSFLNHLAAYKDFADVYSYQDKEEILIVTSNQ